MEGPASARAALFDDAKSEVADREVGDGLGTVVGDRLRFDAEDLTQERRDRVEVGHDRADSWPPAGFDRRVTGAADLTCIARRRLLW